MNQAIRLCTGIKGANGWAWCVESSRPEVIADLHFTATRIGQDLVAHEALHATIIFAKRYELDFFDDVEDEEMLCDIAGTIAYLVGQEVVNLQAGKL